MSVLKIFEKCKYEECIYFISIQTFAMHRKKYSVEIELRQKIWNQLSKAYYLHLFISNLCLMSTNSITIYHSIILKNLTGTAHKNSRNEKNWLHENTLYNFSVLCRIHTFLHVKNKTFLPQFTWLCHQNYIQYQIINLQCILVHFSLCFPRYEKRCINFK